MLCTKDLFTEPPVQINWSYCKSKLQRAVILAQFVDTATSYGVRGPNRSTTPVLIIRETQIKMPTPKECRSLEPAFCHESIVVPDLLVPWGNPSMEKWNQRNIDCIGALYFAIVGRAVHEHRGNAIVEMLPDLFIPVQNLTNQAKEPFSPKHNEL